MKWKDFCYQVINFLDGGHDCNKRAHIIEERENKIIKVYDVPASSAIAPMVASAS